MKPVDGVAFQQFVSGTKGPVGNPERYEASEQTTFQCDFSFNVSMRFTISLLLRVVCVIFCPVVEAHVLTSMVSIVTFPVKYTFKKITAI